MGLGKLSIKKLYDRIKSLSYEILHGLLIVILSTSGLLIAILFRISAISGNFILLGGIIVEIIAMLALYLTFKKFLISEKEGPIQKKVKKLD